MTDRALDLMTDAQVAADAAANAEGLMLDGFAVDDTAGALAIYEVLGQAATALSAAKKLLATAIGEALGPESQVVNGRKVKRHADVSRTQWDSDGLLRLVLDSVRANDDGERIDETALDKVKHVYGLKGYQAKVGAIRERHLDPDEFCRSEFRGWTLEVR